MDRITLIARSNGIRLFRQRFERQPDDWFVLDAHDVATSFDGEAQARSFYLAQANLRARNQDRRRAPAITADNLNAVFPPSR